MIKEVDCEMNAKEKDCRWKSVKIKKKIQSPVNLGIELLQEVNYFKEQLESMKSIEIEGDCQADWVGVESFIHLVCVSQKFKTIFEQDLKGHWFPTNQEDRFIFLLDRCIDALDKEKTEIITKSERPYWYQSIEHEVFKPEIEEEFLFTIPQDPFIRLSTSRFEEKYKHHQLTGIQFYKDINFNRKDDREDMFRWGIYDEEGNRLDKK